MTVFDIRAEDFNLGISYVGVRDESKDSDGCLISNWYRNDCSVYHESHVLKFVSLQPLETKSGEFISGWT